MVTNPEGEWEEEVVRSECADLDRPGHAGTLPAWPGPDHGDDSGPKLLRVPQSALLYRRPQTMSHCFERSSQRVLGPRKRPCFLLRPDRPWLATDQRPNGQGSATPLAESRLPG